MILNNFLYSTTKASIFIFAFAGDVDGKYITGISTLSKRYLSNSF